MDGLQGIFEVKVRQLAGSVLSEPECAALDCATEADVGVSFRGHERMFPRLRIRGVAGSAQARPRTTQRGTN
jgi:hypothetical protein